MDRTPSNAQDTSVEDSLRQNPALAGVPEDVLEQIASLVSSSNTRKISESLKKVQLFEGISDDDAQRLQQVAETVALNPGEILFEEGKKGDSFYIVVRGRVELFKKGRDGAEQKLAVAREGEAFGEMALLNQSPRSATARAVEPASLLEISRDAFDSLLGGDSFAVRMLRGISKTLWATSVRLSSTQAKGGDAREIVRSLSQVMQKSILPPAVPQVPGFSVMAYTGTHEKAGGESAWDWFQRGDGRVVFMLLRAHGEGLPPGHPLVLARTLLRELGRDQNDLGRLLARVNDALVGARVAGAPQKVDCALVALGDGELTWAAAGQVAAAVVRGGGSVVDLPAEAPSLGTERGTPYRTIAVPVMPGDSFLSLARFARGGLARGKTVVSEMAGSEARDIVKKIASSLPTDDPITGDVFENTVLVLKSVEHAAAEIAEGRAVGNGSLGATPVVMDLGGPSMIA